MKGVPLDQSSLIVWLYVPVSESRGGSTSVTDRRKEGVRKEGAQKTLCLILDSPFVKKAWKTLVIDQIVLLCILILVANTGTSFS